MDNKLREIIMMLPNMKASQLVELMDEIVKEGERRHEESMRNRGYVRFR